MTQVIVCPTCNGLGHIIIKMQDNLAVYQHEEETCGLCKGTGRVIEVVSYLPLDKENARNHFDLPKSVRSKILKGMPN